MEKLGRWLGKKKTEPSSRVTRSAASPTSTRASYNEEIIPVELLDVIPAKAMEFPCEDFMECAGIKEEFYTLCENAGLTRLVTSRVPQYETLTAVFVNSFRFYSHNDAVMFRLYDELLTMPMNRFCEVLCLPGLVEKKKRKNIPTVEINTLLDSFCNTEVRRSNRQKISNIMFPHLRYSPIILRGECWLETTRAALPLPIMLSWRMLSQVSMSIMCVRSLRGALLLIVPRETSLVASMPCFFCSLSKESRAQMMLSFLLLVLTWLP